VSRVPSAPVNSVGDALAQPLASLRAMVESLPHPAGAGPLNFLGNPFKYDAPRPLAWPPARGEHSREILQRICGYDEAAIEALVANRIVHSSRPRRTA
jgi:CoA:oxalate CoA-transferase